MVKDWIQIKSLEKLLNRKLSQEEIEGIKSIRYWVNGKVETIRISKVHMLWLHNTNSLANK